VLVRTQFLEQYPDVVAAFLDGHLAALAAIEEDPDAAAAAANASLQSLTGASLAPEVLERAFGEVDFTADPLPATLQASAQHAVEVGLLEEAKLTDAGGLPGSLYALDLLDAALERAGQPAVSTP
jgi:NitT/TauT family transport system substrate-binding protein